jgi:hypothetical protein
LAARCLAETSVVAKVLMQGFAGMEVRLGKVEGQGSGFSG